MTGRRWAERVAARVGWALMGYPAVAGSRDVPGWRHVYGWGARLIDWAARRPERWDP